MAKGGSMQGKALFWFGIALNVLGVVMIVYATRYMLIHAAGVLTVLLGIFLAARNHRS